MFRKVKENVLVKRILESQHDRVLIAAASGFGLNLSYALYHGAVGIMSGSVWLLLLCAYYIVLSVMRFSVVLYDHLSAKNSAAISEQFLFRFLGGMLALLSVLLAQSVYLCLRYDVAIVHPEIMMITIAAYTFYKIIMAIVNAVQARKQQSLWLIAVRNIGCADALAALLTLQRSMLVSFEGMSNRDIALMNVLTGTAVCLLTAALGIDMFFQKEKQNEKIKTGKRKCENCSKRNGQLSKNSGRCSRWIYKN